MHRFNYVQLKYSINMWPEVTYDALAVHSRGTRHRHRSIDRGNKKCLRDNYSCRNNLKHSTYLDDGQIIRRASGRTRARRDSAALLGASKKEKDKMMININRH